MKHLWSEPKGHHSHGHHGHHSHGHGKRGHRGGHEKVVLLQRPESVEISLERPTGAPILLTRPKPTPPTQLKPTVQVQVEKLVDERLWFNSLELSKEPGCFVIGVLGRAGSGKSSLLSSLGGLFKAKTIGIDIWTDDGLILLDTQPILSHSITNVPPRYVKNPKSWMDLQSRQIALFLLTVCNVVVLVADGPRDSSLVKFIRTVEELRGKLFESSSLYQPHLVYMCSRVPLDQFSSLRMTEHLNWFETAMNGSGLQVHSSVSVTGLSVPHLSKSTLNYSLLPVQESYTLSDREWSVSYLQDDVGASFETCFQSLGYKILGVSLTCLPHLSQDAWLKSASKTWDAFSRLDLNQMFDSLR